MLKNFLTVGTLAVALLGGIATASAEGLCPNESVYTANKPYYSRMVVKPNKNFETIFIQKNTMYGYIQWRFQGPIFRCIDEKTGNIAWAASYTSVGN